MATVGQSVPRKDGWEKITGMAKYVGDNVDHGLLHVGLVTSPYAHARIAGLDITQALKVPGVHAVLTGADFKKLTGPIIGDRPILAIDKVRYNGEPVAAVIADDLTHAVKGVERVQVAYEPLPVVLNPIEAMRKNAPLVHERLGEYKKYALVYPEANTNIANHVKIRKGNMEKGWEASTTVIETTIGFGPSDHAAMEPRAVTCEISPDGQIIFHTASQAPYVIRAFMARFFGVEPGDVVVHTPLVGGGFGGKASIQLEFIAYLASKAVGGRKVKLVNTREEDLITSPCHIGLEARVKLGADQMGKIQAAAITYLFDGGAYADMAVIICKAGATDCTGPYAIPNVHCDSYCLYTNHTYATSFRGFGHPELTFAVERAMDLLAKKLEIDPLTLRLRNAIKPGDTTPTQTLLDYSNIGNVTKCLRRLKDLMQWDQGETTVVSSRKIRAKGVAALWKTSSTPTDAGSGAVITFNQDGSANLSCGAVELGQGTKTVLAQIVAERLGMAVEHVHVVMEVDTQSHPGHWKTVASSTTMMAGRAALEAADDAAQQLKRTAAIALRAAPEELALGGERVFLRANPAIGVAFRDIALGYKYPDGPSVAGMVIGRGHYIVRGLTAIDPETGKGVPGPQWTVGAQGVEVELDIVDGTYQILKAYTVMDAGRVIHPQAARGQMMGGMHIGLSFAARESLAFDRNGRVLNPNLRGYKLTRFGEDPVYVVDFIETPNVDGPYGARGIGEYGVIGMPAALANALSAAAGVELNQLPLAPELIWRAIRGKHH
ncbi:xanthine dehydrogenase family protein molybdopterin-binding subunit [Camelliibacillus cellulosilyticus]|uniref:Xanthine dehydrogenase family protein molybdopterin-binding subunit n=1 Tax=Camelliibacillus cellulosilyticus TaxID=2174486 RepID=A0ABV9GP03_9BACL